MALNRSYADDVMIVFVGPRMVLNPIRFFSGSFVGETMYQNPSYQSPNEVRYSFFVKVFLISFYAYDFYRFLSHLVSCEFVSIIDFEQCGRPKKTLVLSNSRSWSV